MKKKEEIITKSASQTREFGKILAKKILKKRKNKRAVLLALKGDLGAGKTTFLQGFAKGLGIKDKITSPTFVIMKRFCRNVPLSGAPRDNFQEFYHIDCYRIKKPKEIFELGFKEIISNPKNIVTIEWPERIEKILPKNTLILKFEFIDNKKRKIIL